LETSNFCFTSALIAAWHFLPKNIEDFCKFTFCSGSLGQRRSQVFQPSPDSHVTDPDLSVQTNRSPPSHIQRLANHLATDQSPPPSSRSHVTDPFLTISTNHRPGIQHHADQAPIPTPQYIPEPLALAVSITSLSQSQFPNPLRQPSEHQPCRAAARGARGSGRAARSATGRCCATTSKGSRSRRSGAWRGGAA
jgi:hypothetical protein